MSDTRHTPGPWVVHGHNQWDKRIAFGRNWPVGWIDSDDIDYAEAEANARLAAAAPDMLEVLKATAEHWRGRDGGASWYARILWAIDKAEKG